MTIQADIITALAGVAGDRVFPDAANEKDPTPLVVMYRTAYEPLMTLQGPAGLAKSTFVFECWGGKTPSGGAKSIALTTAKAVQDALAAAPESLTRYQEPIAGEKFDPETLEMMEPVSYSFWHDDP